MYDEKMVVKIEMFFDVDNNEDYQELKTVEHHADRLLDLDNWPEIKSVYNVSVKRVHEEVVPYERLLRILQDYVGNDYEATSDSGYVRDALYAAGCGEEIMKALGFDWLFDALESNGEEE